MEGIILDRPTRQEHIMGLMSKFWLVALAGLLGAVSIARAETASVLMEEGLYLEQTVGEPAGAIKIYQKLIDSDDATDEQKAQAMYRLGTCRLKLRETATAIEMFNKVVAEYPQSASAVQARTRLARLTAPDPSILFPPDTVLYVEVGSPGKQVATLVEMLKGTPLANPLALVGPNQQGNSNRSSQTPADILAALLNPSMIEEFKKVRGMAFGVTNIPFENQPPGVFTLYPGESDALRGLVTALFLLQGQPVEPIEGMQTVNMGGGPDGTFACFDDNVIIVAMTRQQLVWSVKQYKGLTRNPSLSTANNSFMALTSKKARRDDALTVWANPAEIFRMLKPRMNSREMAMANAMVDFEGIEGLAVRLVLDSSEITAEVSLAFKPDHKSFAFDMIRTPPMSAAGFIGVPENAIGVAAFAMADAETNKLQAGTARNVFRRITGLDLGRELFNNIEQVNLFAMPAGTPDPNDIVIRAFGPLAAQMAVAVTSADSAQTAQLIRKFTSPMSAVMLDPALESPLDDDPGRFPLIAERAGVIYGYHGQAGSTNVLSFSPDARDLAMAAAGGDETTGQFVMDFLNGSDFPSKLAYVKVGGAIRMFEAQMISQGQLQIAQGQSSALSKLADLFDGTSVEFYTVEEPELFKARLAVRNLPPLAEAIPLVMQLQGQMRTGTSRRVSQPRTNWKEINVAKQKLSPVTVDGTLDEWDELPFLCTRPAEIIKQPRTWKGPKDGSFKFAVAYDEEYLYIAARVTDDKIHQRPGDVAWRREHLSILLDARSKSERLAAKNDPLQHISLVAFGAAEPVIDTNVDFVIKNLTPGPDGSFVGQRHIARRQAMATWGGSMDEIILARLITETGYDVEAAIPISYIEALQGKPWKDFRLNMVLLDYDAGRSGDRNTGSMLYWRYDWRRNKKLQGSDTFIREGSEQPIQD